MEQKRHIKDLQRENKSLLNQRGVTLVELLISLAILGMVFVGAQLLNSYGLFSFSKGKIQTDLQQQLRIADTFITNEVRHATEIEILEEIPESFDDKYNYIFIDNDSNIVSIKGTTRKTIVEGISSLEFKSEEAIGLDEILAFKIYDSEKNQQYEVEKRVQPINITLLDSVIKNKDKVGIGVKYHSILPLTIDKTKLIAGMVGTPYSHRFTAFGGTPPYTFYIDGLPPQGLSIDQNTGFLSGVPSKKGEYTLNVTVEDVNLEKDNYNYTLIINDASSGIPDTPPYVRDANSIGWLNGNSGNVNAAKLGSDQGVKFDTNKSYGIVLRSQEANFTTPELYFENNLLIQSGATMVLNSQQIVFRGVVQLEKKNKKPSGKLCVNLYNSQDVTIYFVGGVYDGDTEIVRPNSIITVKSVCYGGN